MAYTPRYIRNQQPHAEPADASNEGVKLWVALSTCPYPDNVVHPEPADASNKAAGSSAGPQPDTNRVAHPESADASNKATVWTLDSCPRLDAGVMLLPADLKKLAAVAATVFCITQEQAAMQIRPFLLRLMFWCDKWLLADVQREPLLATLRAAEKWARRRGEYEVPEAAEVRTCASCGASITWITTEAGAAMPLALNTVERRGGRQFALTHYVSCPDANDWRQHKKRFEVV